jgi:hypothetical protein
MAETSATAEGELAKTPFAHLLVYALDRRLTGVLFLKQPDGVEHVVRLARGVPVKVRPGDRYALLGEMLVEAGAIDRATLEEALATKGLLGDMLLLAGRVDGDVLEKVAEQQFIRRMVRLFSLPKETVFRYCGGHDELAEYGGDPADVDPLALVWAGLRAHGDVDVRMGPTLARVGDSPLRLHASATVSRFGCCDEEAKLIERLCDRPSTIAELDALGHVPPEVVRRFVYALLITRQLDLGTGTLPIGSAPAAPDPTRGLFDSDSSRSAVLPQAPASTIATVAKMKIVSTLHRVGAAAPDLPGDGERGAPNVLPRRRDGESPSRPSRSMAAVKPPEAEAEEPPSSSGKRDVVKPQAAPSAEGEPARDSGVMPAEPARHAGAGQRSGPRADEPSMAPSPTLRSQPAPVIEPPPPPAPPADPLAGLPLSALLEHARERLSERDPKGAVAACEAAAKVAPEDPDAIVLGCWARSQLASPDLKALTVALDEVLHSHEAHVEGRFYRALLRKKLGDEASAVRDLRRVLELVPGHEGATRELASAEAKQKSKDRPSLFGRLFKR